MHIRRIKTEEKAKVVASVRGEEFIKFLAALVVLHFDNYDDTNMMNSSLSFKSFGCNSSYYSKSSLHGKTTVAARN